MQGSGGLWRKVPLLAVFLIATAACRKPAEAVKSDLGEAGYELTTADWLKAGSRDDVSALKKFVAAGFNTDSSSGDGDSALHAAAFAGARKAADYLLERGLAVDLPGASGRTPLMAAVLGKQKEMTGWLLRQGADPRIKDKDGYAALMLAVREGASGAVEELAPYHRDSLDSAILLAALLGQAEAIDTLTNYGASVHARMEDGRTPLMLAAQNGHKSAVELLLDIGSSRFSTDSAGHTAADLATAAGHAEIAAMISRDPLPKELALESPAEAASEMDAFVEAAAKNTTGKTEPATSREPVRQIEGETLGASVSAQATPPATGTSVSKPGFPLPPLVMRHYRERELPVEVSTVEKETATLAIRGSSRREVKVRAGDIIPGSNLVVVRVQRRMEDSKLNLGQSMEVSVVEVRDNATGATRSLISGVPANAHDPLALVEDSSTGRRYTAKPGQRFKSKDGTEFIISDVRPNQIVIEEAASGATQTIPLRGPRG
jgi:ankyrin repeat protein